MPPAPVTEMSRAVLFTKKYQIPGTSAYMHIIKQAFSSIGTAEAN
jgi:hypothetical protein